MLSWGGMCSEAYVPFLWEVSWWRIGAFKILKILCCFIICFTGAFTWQNPTVWQEREPKHTYYILVYFLLLKMQCKSYRASQTVNRSVYTSWVHEYCVCSWILGSISWFILTRRKYLIIQLISFISLRTNERKRKTLIKGFALQLMARKFCCAGWLSSIYFRIKD